MHCLDRLKERYGLELTESELQEATDLCRAAFLAQRQPHGREIRVFRYRGRALIAVYDPRSDVIVSFMPPDWLNAGQSGKRNGWHKGHKSSKQRLPRKTMKKHGRTKRGDWKRDLEV